MKKRIKKKGKKVMNNHEPNTENGQTVSEEQQAPEAAQAAEQTSGAQTAETETPTQEEWVAALEKTVKERDSYKDSWMRSQAEFQNFKRRNATVRTEAVTLVDGNGLKDFSVVVGSFSLKSNALGLQQRLKNQGHPAQVAYNPSINYYRVIVSTFDNKASAVQSRNQFRATYPDAWLLLKK